MKQKAFTLIELLVVLAIIGVISSITLVSLAGTKEKARIAKNLQFSQSIYHSLGAYAIGVWRFDKVGGNQTPDASGYGHNCTVNGAVQVEGIIGKAMEFVGSEYFGDYLVCGKVISPNLINEITIEAWVKLYSPEVDAYEYIVSSVGTIALAKSDVGDGGNFKFAVRVVGGPGWGTAYGSIPDADKWYHLVGSYDGNTIYLYVNGELEGSDDHSGNLDSSITSDLSIGCWYDDEGWAFVNGIIDEVRIYEVALTIGEIQKHYVEGLERHKLVEN